MLETLLKHKVVKKGPKHPETKYFYYQVSTIGRKYLQSATAPKSCFHELNVLWSRRNPTSVHAPYRSALCTAISVRSSRYDPHKVAVHLRRSKTLLSRLWRERSVFAFSSRGRATRSDQVRASSCRFFVRGIEPGMDVAYVARELASSCLSKRLKRASVAAFSSTSAGLEQPMMTVETPGGSEHSPWPRPRSPRGEPPPRGGRRRHRLSCR